MLALRAPICTAAAAFLLLRATTLAAQAPADDAGALMQSIVAVDSARTATAEAIASLVAGVRHPLPAVQQLAVRVLGRLERASAVPSIAAALESSSAAVRAEAANALAQAVQGAANQNAVAGVTKTLRSQLEGEKDPAVRAVVYESLGRMAHASASEAREIEAVQVQGSQ
jgi:HEAT repeat protein